jgi:hypothetical protein
MTTAPEKTTSGIPLRVVNFAWSAREQPEEAMMAELVKEYVRVSHDRPVVYRSRRDPLLHHAVYAVACKRREHVRWMLSSVRELLRRREEADLVEVEVWRDTPTEDQLLARALARYEEPVELANNGMPGGAIFVVALYLKVRQGRTWNKELDAVERAEEERDEMTDIGCYPWGWRPRQLHVTSELEQLFSAVSPPS